MTTNQEMTIMDAMDTLYAAKNWKSAKENQANAEKLNECVKAAMEFYGVGVNEGAQKLLWDMGFRDDEHLDWISFFNEIIRQSIYYHITEVLTYEDHD